MKNTLLLVFSIVLIFPVYACEICGATNSSLGFGSLEQGNKHSIGLHYQFRNYTSEHPILFSHLTEKSKEYFQRIEIKGQIRLNNWAQVQVSVPISYNFQKKNANTYLKTGLADPIITGVFYLLNKSDSANTKRVRWTAGAGIKIPLGAFPIPEDELLLLYPGTGTFDGQFQSTLYFKKNKWSTVIDLQGMIRGANKYQYKPGATFSSTLFVQRSFKKWALFSGAQYAWNGTDYKDRKAINSSPSLGSILTGTLGLSVPYKKWLLQGNYHLPLVQQLSLGYTKQHHAFVCSITYFI
jgi:hypothetical protein